MPFTLRPHRRFPFPFPFPLHCAVTYHARQFLTLPLAVSEID